MAFTPYLNFPGTCREAFTRYHEIFGGELNIVGMGDMPADDQAEMPPGMEDLVMNAAIMTDDGGLLMGSDSPPDQQGVAQYMYANYSTADVEDAKRVWAALVEGGEVEMDGGETFWSPFFGVCKDRFGTPWMVNTEPAEPWQPS
jgi:PhnB protein